MLSVIEAFTHNDYKNQLAISFGVNTLEFYLYNFNLKNKIEIEIMGFQWADEQEIFFKKIPYETHQQAERVLQMNMDMFKFSGVEFVMSEMNLAHIDDAKFKIQY